MDIVVKIIAVAFILMGVLLAAYPQLLKRLIGLVAKGIRIYLIGLIRLALAVVFLLAARECKNFWLIFIFGILFLLSGLLVFLLGPRRLRPMLDWLQRQSALLLRVLAVVIVLIGILIVVEA